MSENPEVQRHLLEIFRVQLSEDELVLIFYNGLSPYGREGEPGTFELLNRHRLMKNLRKEILIDEQDLELYPHLEADERERQVVGSAPSGRNQ